MSEVTHSIYGAGYIVRPLKNHTFLVKFQGDRFPKVIHIQEICYATRIGPGQSNLATGSYD